MERGKIQVVGRNNIRIVTEIYNEETVDFFTFDEVIDFIKKERTKQTGS